MTSRRFSVRVPGKFCTARYAPRGPVPRRRPSFGTGAWRRRAVWLALTIFALFVFPGFVGALAVAQDAAGTTAGVSEIDGLSWMNIRDSSGIRLSDYRFATGDESMFKPRATILWAVLGLEFIGYIAIVTTAIWLIGYALSFRWLDMFSVALRGVADAVTEQIATPIVLVTAASIGAFFVAWFIVRGYHAKATMQVVTMVGVAVLGPVFLAEPLADVLSSDGLLAQGRDLGISVAAGLNGNANPNPSQLVTTMQSDLADNFARQPLQVWNFGHAVDVRPACRSAWSAGVAAGDDGRVITGMKACGDTAAQAKAENPSMGQVATGLMLLVCGGILLIFAMYLGIKVIKAALDTIYHGIMSIFGFAAGGFVYGPTQTFLVRNLVDSFVAAARMTAYTIFLGVYVLFMGNLFAQARGQVMAVIIIAGTVEIVAIFQLKRLSSSLSRGNDWIANRFSLTIQGSQTKSSSSGAMALGMGGGGGNASSGMGFVSSLGALNTINSSPVTAWLAGGTINPFNPLANTRRSIERSTGRILASREQGYVEHQLSRTNWRRVAVTAATQAGGMHTQLGVSRALKALRDNKVPESRVHHVLLASGARHEMVNHSLAALSTQESTVSQNPYGFAPLQKAIATAWAVDNHVGHEAHDAFAAQAVIAADSFVRHSNAPAPGAAIDHAFVQRVESNWHSDRALRAAITPDEWNGAGRDTRWAIGHRAATMHQDAAQTYYANPTDINRDALMQSARRVANLDHLDPEGGLDPWNP
ncbi:hypothetical protein OHA40_22790 [Nocardia sp. NBC_00508]|uniref:hypothetical protein n=1 Tax=Nocardia sp. NBC_00508 TaxID=2975992 RepID=UPI002E800DE7|nr:hypothetical protein [Nocardia sp. NBC_00508]WUD64503.1 hypothetical protein OHA40_22790 [Nocardia sp. NBC_00508]